MNKGEVSLRMEKMITAGFGYTSALLLAILVMAGCASVAERGESFQAAKCSSYSSCQDKDGLHVAVEAFQDKRRVEKYFGADLLDKGIVPLLVIAENHNTASSFLLPYGDVDVARLAYNISGTANEQQHDGKSLSLESAQGAVHEEAGKDLVKEFLGGGIILYQVLFVDLGPTEQSAALKQELAVKALTKRTLSPGKEQAGFIYFTVPPKYGHDVHLRVKLKALNLKSQTAETFSFPVVIQKGD